MRSPLRGVWRSALLVVVIVAVASECAAAQRLACSTIRPGETAAHVAARIAGNAHSRHQPWFQIVDPRTRRFVAKADYGRIRAGWHACIVTTSAPAHIAGAGAAVVGMLNRIESTCAFVGLLVLFGLATWRLDKYMKRRQVVSWQLKGFGERFVQEFERPLVPSRPFERVIDSRLRCSPHRARLDVLLAPRDGRCYPNLADHKRNVEYDVTRVLQVLKDHPFVHGPPYARGRWVVVPFQLTVNARQAGGQ